MKTSKSNTLADEDELKDREEELDVVAPMGETIPDLKTTINNQRADQLQGLGLSKKKLQTIQSQKNILAKRSSRAINLLKTDPSGRNLLSEVTSAGGESTLQERMSNLKKRVSVLAGGDRDKSLALLKEL